ncbi:MAG: WYL domain-containing protein [Deltaproteobacteria bacterium]|nr:WYL domain-containing protein [Deltaproteobacteria bacterium]
MPENKINNDDNNGTLTRTEKCLSILRYILDAKGVKSMSIDLACVRAQCERETARKIFQNISYYLPNMLYYANDSLILRESKANDIVDAVYFERISPEDQVLAKLVIEQNRDLLGVNVTRAIQNIIGKFNNNVGEANPSDITRRDIPVYRLGVREIIDYTSYRDNLVKLLAAFQENKVCYISKYIKSNGAESEFWFCPLEIWLFREKFYIHGFRSLELEGKKQEKRPINLEERTLQINRIGQVEITEMDIDPQLKSKENPFLRQRGEDNQVQESFGFMHENPFALEALFDPSLSYLKDYKWPNDTQITLNNRSIPRKYRNWLKLIMRCGSQREALTWLLGFGSKVVILRPTGLIKKYRFELQQMCEVNGLRPLTTKRNYSRIKHKAVDKPFVASNQNKEPSEP